MPLGRRTFFISIGRLSHVMESKRGDVFHNGRSALSGVQAATCRIYETAFYKMLSAFPKDKRIHYPSKTYLCRLLQLIKQLSTFKVQYLSLRYSGRNYLNSSHEPLQRSQAFLAPASRLSDAMFGRFEFEFVNKGFSFHKMILVEKRLGAGIRGAIAHVREPKL